MSKVQTSTTDADFFDVSPAALRAAMDRKDNDGPANRLKSYIERVERLEEEKAATANDIKEVYGEAKGTGFDTKVMRQIVRIRKMDQADRAEQEELLDLYQRALGMSI